MKSVPGIISNSTEGIETVQDLLKTPLEQLLAIPGIGDKTAEKLLEEAVALQERRTKELEEEAARAEAEAAEAAAAVAAPEAADEAPTTGDASTPEADQNEPAAATATAEEERTPDA
jgi:Holliday junction resolvasome RuvABC DNA-binding subunit